MKIINTAPPVSAVKKNQYPEQPLPEIAMFGRSNAGKSSMINVLINRKNLARTSSAPGKTRLLNFYRIEGRNESEQALVWHFVDLPGYGYAKVSKSERDNWLRIIEEYLRTENKRICWHLLDIRHKPSVEDVAMHDILIDTGFPVVTIANKADKISKNARIRSLKIIADTLNISSKEIEVFSAISREGREKLLAVAEDFLLSE